MSERERFTEKESIDSYFLGRLNEIGKIIDDNGGLKNVIKNQGSTNDFSKYIEYEREILKASKGANLNG